MFTMENCFYLLISQAVRYLRDPAVHPRDKQRMKQELSSELVSSSYRPSLFSESVSCGRRSLVVGCPVEPIPQRESTVLGVVSCSHCAGSSATGSRGACVWKKLTCYTLLISEYAALQPVSLLPPWWSLVTCQRGPSLSPRKICLQAGSRGAGAFVPAGAGLRPARAEIDAVPPRPPFPVCALERLLSTTAGVTFGRARNKDWAREGGLVWAVG